MTKEQKIQNRVRQAMHRKKMKGLGWVMLSKYVPMELKTTLAELITEKVFNK